MEIRIEGWDWGLRIGIGDLGLRIGEWDWELGLPFGIWHLIFLTTSDNHFFNFPLRTLPCLIVPKLLTFQVIHQNKSCLLILEESENNTGANFSVIQQPYNCQRSII